MTFDEDKLRQTSGALAPNRHHRGWPQIELLTFIVETDQSWRFCIEPMGYRDAIWERGGYLELIQWKRIELKLNPLKE
jgi:hypothetical protein